MEGFYYSAKKFNEEDKGAEVKFNARISMTIYSWIDDVKVRISGIKEYNEYLEYKGQDEEYAYFEKTIYLERCAIYRYKFSFCSEWTKHYESDEEKISVSFEVPDWAKDAVMYQIFPDRFYRDYSVPIHEFGKRIIHRDWHELPIVGPDKNGEWARDSYGGNFKGIKKRLKYLKGLGIDIIYLNPIFTSSSNHKYDAENFRIIDPFFGGEIDFIEFVRVAHNVGIKVIVDVSFNHVGKDSVYYNKSGAYEEPGAYQGPQSKYFPFFKTRVENGKIIFDYWWGIEDEVVLDKDSKEYQEYICGVGGVIDWLFSLGIDGLRIDVADDLTDYFINLMAEACRRNKPDFLMIIEVWKNPFRMNRNYILDGKSAHSFMNYYFKAPLMDYINLQDDVYLREKINEELQEFPDGTIHTAMNFTSTHDISRQLNQYANEGVFLEKGHEEREWPWKLKKVFEKNQKWQQEYTLPRDVYKNAKKLLKLEDFILTFWPGIFSIFYGDEAGVQGYGNLSNRKSFPWGRRDKDITSYVRKLIKIRHKYWDFLRVTDTNILELTPDKFVFERVKDDQKIIVIVNNGDYDIEVIYRGEVITMYNADDRVIRSKGAIALLVS